jgi:hypothetical protein
MKYFLLYTGFSKSLNVKGRPVSIFWPPYKLLHAVFEFWCMFTLYTTLSWYYLIHKN